MSSFSITFSSLETNDGKNVIFKKLTLLTQDDTGVKWIEYSIQIAHIVINDGNLLETENTF